MFRDGQYLEVIKASDNCLATAVVTVQQKIIKIKKKEVSTNKWLDLEDWAALYKILERAILKNSRENLSHKNLDNFEWKKSTRQLEVTYTFEPPECLKDIASLPTLRVNVSPARKRTEKIQISNQASKEQEEYYKGKSGTQVDTSPIFIEKGDKSLKESDGKHQVPTQETSKSNKDKTRRYLQSDELERNVLEEYVPDAPKAKKLHAELKYVPSRKSTLENLQTISNEYTPTVSDNKLEADIIKYVPNSIKTVKTPYETYEPRATTVPRDVSEEYIPSSKGHKPSIEEYQPDFTSKSMKFDNSYIPSSVQTVKQNSQKPTEKLGKFKPHKNTSRHKESILKKANPFT